MLALRRLGTLGLVGVLYLGGFGLVTLAPAWAQPRPPRPETAAVRLSGIGVHAGSAQPENATAAFMVGAQLGLGSLFKPWLRLVAGADAWSADLDRGDARGSLSDLSIHARLRWDLFETHRTIPYVYSGLAVHRIDADVPGDALLESALSDVQPGFDLGFGIGHVWKGVRFSGQFGRSFVSDADNWNLLFGMGWWRGRHRSNTTALQSSTAPPSPSLLHAEAP